MKNDKKILRATKELRDLTEEYIDNVAGASFDAYSDRILENLLEKAKEIQKLHDENEI